MTILAVYQTEDGLVVDKYTDFKEFYDEWVKDTYYEDLDGLEKLLKEYKFKFYKIEKEVFIIPKNIKYEFGVKK